MKDVRLSPSRMSTVLEDGSLEGLEGYPYNPYSMKRFLRLLDEAHQFCTAWDTTFQPSRPSVKTHAAMNGYGFSDNPR